MHSKQFSIRSGALALTMIAAGFLASQIQMAPAWVGSAGLFLAGAGILLVPLSFKRTDSHYEP